MEKNKKFSLITGSTQGIGYELAKCCAIDGYDLVLVARNKDRLIEVSKEFEKKYNITVIPIAMDLSVTGSAKKLYAKLKKLSINPYNLINNAGFSNYGNFKDIEIEQEISLINLNILTLTELTKYLLKDMLTQNEGKILNVASTAAFQPGPLMATYYASKAYILFLSEALANELKETGITVTALCPGATKTGFQKRLGIENSLLINLGSMEASKVAKIGYEGMKKGKTLVVPGIKNKIGVFLVRLAPRKIVVKIIRKLQEV